MRIEFLDGEEDLVGVVVLLKPAGGSREDLRREVFLLHIPVPDVGEILPEERVEMYVFPLPDGDVRPDLVRRGETAAVAVLLLTAYPGPLVESAMEIP